MKITQAELANIMDIGQSAVSKIVNGQNPLSLVNGLKLANGLQLSVEEILAIDWIQTSLDLQASSFDLNQINRGRYRLFRDVVYYAINGQIPGAPAESPEQTQLACADLLGGFSTEQLVDGNTTSWLDLGNEKTSAIAKHSATQIVKCTGVTPF